MVKKESPWATVLAMFILGRGTKLVAKIVGTNNLTSWLFGLSVSCFPELFIRGKVGERTLSKVAE